MQMARTLDTLMAVARAQLDPSRTTSDASACARAAADACAPLAAAEGVEIAVDGLPARVAVSADVLERILAPLLENACRYGRSRVRVSVAAAGTVVFCTVEDDGPGVDPDELEPIFEPGRRGSGEGGAPVATAGAGLGLALARRLARAAGGDVRAEASESGARFVVQLPA
jgi:two-component system, OmpR family, sensor kinase